MGEPNNYNDASLSNGYQVQGPSPSVSSSCEYQYSYQQHQHPPPAPTYNDAFIQSYFDANYPTFAATGHSAQPAAVHANLHGYQ